MGQFFHGWKRKVGIIALVFACAVTPIWNRSLAIIDVIRFTVCDNQFVVVTYPGEITVWRLDVPDLSDSWFTIEVRSSHGLDVVKSFYAMTTKAPEAGKHYVRIWLCPIVFSLTVASACLILWTPRTLSMLRSLWTPRKRVTIGHRFASDLDWSP